jgi:hypothetical protein
MGLLSGQENIIDEGLQISDEVHYKKLFFTYINAHVPVLGVLTARCSNGWAANACHIELDVDTIKYLLEHNAIKLSKTHTLYANWNAVTESRYDKHFAVPVEMYYISEAAMNEEYRWEQDLRESVATEDEFYDIIDRYRSELKQYMINYYKNKEKYGVA